MATRNPNLNAAAAAAKRAAASAAAVCDEAEAELQGPRGEWWWTGRKPWECPGFDKHAGVLRCEGGGARARQRGGHGGGPLPPPAVGPPQQCSRRPVRAAGPRPASRAQVAACRLRVRPAPLLTPPFPPLCPGAARPQGHGAAQHRAHDAG